MRLSPGAKSKGNIKDRLRALSGSVQLYLQCVSFVVGSKNRGHLVGEQDKFGFKVSSHLHICRPMVAMDNLHCGRDELVMGRP